ncbi:MAG: hypothetical protein R2770_18335 [Acidimicrobiales bacterium]
MNTNLTFRALAWALGLAVAGAACGGDTAEVDATEKPASQETVSETPAPVGFAPEAEVFLSCPDEPPSYVQVLAPPRHPDWTTAIIQGMGDTEGLTVDGSELLILKDVTYSDELQPGRSGPTRLVGPKLNGDLVIGEIVSGARVMAVLSLEPQQPEGVYHFVVSLRPDGRVLFLGECGESLTKGFDEFLDWLRSRDHPVGSDGPTIAIGLVSGDESIEAAQQEFFAEQLEASRPKTWEERSPENRTVDPLDGTPPEVLDKLKPVTIELTMPKQWADQTWGICPRQSLGWLICFTPAIAQSDTPTVINTWINPTEPLLFYLGDLDQGLDTAIGPIQQIGPEQLTDRTQIRLAITDNVTPDDIKQAIQQGQPTSPLQITDAD